MADYNGKEILFSPSISMSIGVVKEYKETNIYNKGDIVSYGGKLYTPKADNVSGVLPTTEATWEELTSGKADKVELEQLQESVERDHNLLDERLANLESGKADKDDFETLQENVESDHNWLIEVDALSITANITSAELADKAIITDGRLADLEQTDIITNKRISNLESATLDFIEDSTIAYSKTVPENALPYAKVTKIGGMTRKCTNLIPFPYELSTVSNGTTFAVNQDLSIDVSGKPTVSIYNTVATLTLKAGTYSLHNYSSLNANVRLYITYGNITLFANDTFTLSEETSVRVRIAVYDTFDGNTVRIVPMLNIGSTALPYEPYFEGLRSAPVSELVSEGANLFDAKSISSSKQYATVSLSGDDVVVEGTYYASFSINLKANVEYSISYTVTSDERAQVNLKYKSGVLSQALIQNQTFIPLEDVDEIYLYSGNGTIAKTIYHNFMINKGSTAMPYRPYFKRTLPIPEAVRPAHGINENVYDYIEWCEDGTRKKRVKCGVADMADLTWNRSGVYWYTRDVASNILVNWRAPDVLADNYNTHGWDGKTNGDVTMNGDGYICVIDDVANRPTGKLLYALAEPKVTDISDILTADNFVEVQAYGSMTPVNEFGYAVPTTINYITDIGE